MFLRGRTLRVWRALLSRKTYQQHWCKINGGTQEVILFDKARVDCLTKTHAIEFDFAPKWAESIGQALYYSIVTGKTPGIVLIMENPKKDQKYLARVNSVAKSTEFPCGQ